MVFAMCALLALSWVASIGLTAWATWKVAYPVGKFDGLLENMDPRVAAVWHHMERGAD
jgi:hypothetical protein